MEDFKKPFLHILDFAAKVKIFASKGVRNMKPVYFDFTKHITQKKMTKAGLAAIEHVFDPAKDKIEDLDIPPDILHPLKANEQAWAHFQKMPESYKRIRIAYIESRKRHGREMFEKSLNHFIEMTARNKRFGFVKEMS